MYLFAQHRLLALLHFLFEILRCARRLLNDILDSDNIIFTHLYYLHFYIDFRIFIHSH